MTMKRLRRLKLSAVCLLCFPSLLPAATTIDSANKLAYAANLGWIDCRGDVNNGAVIGEYVCSGCIYAANAGWINLGSGIPANGIQYQNNAADFGVNHDGLGHLRGRAWGANIGWIAFEDTGAPSVDLVTGDLSGCVWSANCGWISLSNAVAHVRTANIQQGTLAPNGLPVAWLLTWFGTTDIDPNDDGDLDGQSNAQEYLAGTNPNDTSDVLRITKLSRGTPGNPAHTEIIWSFKPDRFYAVQSAAGPASAAWTDLLTFPYAGVGSASFSDANTNHFFRIRAFRPLCP